MPLPVVNCYVASRGVIGSDNTCYLSSDSFRGVDIQPYLDIQYLIPY